MSTPSPLEQIFFAAIQEKSLEERAAYLDEVCANDRELRERVERMLAAQAHADSFLEVPAHEAQATVSRAACEQAGTLIGSYKLLQEIGEGGFGVVYMAEQSEPVRRKVALKIIKPGMDSREVVARFEAERQALAIMDHPNIAKVLDAGTTDGGRPYFVMELIRGVPLTDYCDRNNLDTHNRLELFTQVCRAVQHAHQKGIIHRDIKPSNVLVTLHDGRPVPKVIDFGIAKVLNQQLTQKTLFTRYGQMVGTPAYMSPEQAEMSGLDVDTRSDVYSLGVLLYELLTGSTPFDDERLRSAGYKEMQRIILEETPVRPSRRVTTLGDELNGISGHRRVEPQKLQQLLRGELDWIVMKTLEKERGQRYESASGLAADVERFVRREPVEAGPPSAWYRLRKYHQRHRTTLLTVASFAMVLIAATVVSTSFGIWTWNANIELKNTTNLLLEQVKNQVLVYAMSGDLEKAIVQIELARKLGADDAWCGLLRGAAQLYAGDAKDAIETLTAAKQKAPESTAVRGALALAYLSAGKGYRWVTECSDLKTMVPPADDAEAHLFKAANLGIPATPEELTSLLDRYFDLRGDSAVGRIVRATLLAAIAARTRSPGPLIQAERDALVATELTRGSDAALTACLHVHDTGYHIYSLKGDQTQTQHHLQLAEEAINSIRENSRSIRAHEAAANFLYERLGDTERARFHWQAARKHGGPDCNVRYARFLLKTDGPEATIEILKGAGSPSLERAIIGLDLPAFRTESLEILETISRDLTLHSSLRSIASALLLASGKEEASAAGLELLGKMPKWTERENVVFPADKLDSIHGLGLLVLGLHMTILNQRDNALRSFDMGKDEPKASFTFWPAFCDILYTVMEGNPNWPLPAGSVAHGD